MIRQITILFLVIFLTSFATATQVCQTYDDFSSDSLDSSKWEIRQDVEGQLLMDEYGVNSSLEVFHTQQNSIADRRVYLYPKRTFITGDILEYDFDAISKGGTSGQMTLLDGDQYIRVGIMGDVVTNLGSYHVKIEFQENNFHLERTKPSGEILIDDLSLTNANGTYELYVGSYTGNDGMIHIDFDNFKTCFEQTEEERLTALEQRVDELENRVNYLENSLNDTDPFPGDLEQRVEDLEERTSWLEETIDKILKFIRKGLPKGLGKRFDD